MINISLELEQLDFDMKIELDGKNINVPEKKVSTEKEKDEKALLDFIVNK